MNCEEEQHDGALRSDDLYELSHIEKRSYGIVVFTKRKQGARIAQCP